jgi:uncharacterized integral membrane protein
MKILSAFLALVVLIPMLCFALPNRQDVAVAFWPFDDTMQLPLYLIGLGPLAFGLIFGAVWGWIGSVPHRLKSRRLHKELDALNDKISELQKSATAQQAPLQPKRAFWERKL